MEWVAVGVRRTLASAECGFDVRKRQERKGADRQCRRGESKDRGSEGTRTGGSGDGNCKAAERATERGGDERKEGRPSTFYSRRFASGELGRHACRVPTVEDEPVPLQMQ